MRADVTRARLLAAVRPEDLLRFRSVADVACSADGATIAYTVSEIDAAADEYVSSIWIADAAGAQPPKRLTELGKKKSGAPRISPDGTLVAVISDRESEKPQLCVMPASGGQAKRLTDLPLGVMRASWSPDAKRLLFAARVADAPPPNDDGARERWDEPPRDHTPA